MLPSQQEAKKLGKMIIMLSQEISKIDRVALWMSDLSPATSTPMLCSTSDQKLNYRSLNSILGFRDCEVNTLTMG